MTHFVMFEGLRCIGLQWPVLAVAPLHSECTHPSTCEESCSALCRRQKESDHRLPSRVMSSSSKIWLPFLTKAFWTGGAKLLLQQSIEGGPRVYEVLGQLY